MVGLLVSLWQGVDVGVVEEGLVAVAPGEGLEEERTVEIKFYVLPRHEKMDSTSE